MGVDPVTAMAGPVTLFSGQWADLPLEELAAKAAGIGFDGLEFARWGDHFEVDKALADDGYPARPRELLDRHDLGVRALGLAVKDRHARLVSD